MQLKDNSGDVYDPTVRYVPLEEIENKMNDVDPKLLSKYLDPEFLGATPDSKTKDSGQLEIEEKEKLELDFELEEEEDEAIEREKLEAAILTPREYQYELYEKALHDNVIVVLDTGAGKTLISIMLIKQQVLNEKQARLHRIEVHDDQDLS